MSLCLYRDKQGRRKEEWEIEEEKYEKSLRMASPSLLDNKMEKVRYLRGEY